jgi:RNA polymerase sigma factor (sigma-70 family)
LDSPFLEGQRGANGNPPGVVISELDRWFAAEILLHEAALTRYLRRRWMANAEIPDLRQEVYVRVYESAAQDLPTSPRAFLFATARNLLADRVRRERIVSINYTQDLDVLNVLVDEITPEHRLSARQELRRLSDALDALPDDCRDVVWLRRVEGLPQREVAQRLGMHEGTLESHLCRGVRALARAVFGSASAKDAQERIGSDHESKLG